MKEKVNSYIRQLHMIEPGEHIIVGVSGGADSVCLLFLLCRFAEELSFRISVAHINHGLRKTAERDSLFVKRLCMEYNIPCFVETVDVTGLVKEKGFTVEEAARKLRFEAFRRIKDRLHADKIALAHHKGDQAETVLFRLCRGTGIDGLCGIHPVRDDIIHPLLCADRNEIEAFLKSEGLSFVTDETNAQTIYKRNVIRHNVLPVLTDNICSETKEHIAQTAELCLEASDYLGKQTAEACSMVLKMQQSPLGVYDKALLYQPELLIDSGIKDYHPYLQKSIIHEAIARMAGVRKDIGTRHILSVLGLFDRQVGRSINLPCHIKAARIYEGVLLTKEMPSERGVSFKAVGKEEAVSESGSQPVIGQFSDASSPAASQLFCGSRPAAGQTVSPLCLRIDMGILGKIGQEYILPDGKILSIRLFLHEKTEVIPKKPYTKWFDYDKIDGHLVLRRRETGDYFYIDDTKRQTVKAYMINNKIPGRLRDKIPIIAEGNHVLWIVGHRISSFYKVSEYTDRILEITIRGGTDDG